jgi:hypothetical protein
VCITGSGTDTVTLAEELHGFRAAVGAMPFAAVVPGGAARYWLVSARWGVGQNFAVNVGAIASALLPDFMCETQEECVAWFSGGDRYRGGEQIDGAGPIFGSYNPPPVPPSGQREERMAFKLEHSTLSLRALHTGETDSMELPEQLRGSAEWRPAIDMAYPGSVTLSALPAAEEW